MRIKITHSSPNMMTQLAQLADAYRRILALGWPAQCIGMGMLVCNEFTLIGDAAELPVWADVIAGAVERQTGVQVTLEGY